MAVRVDTSGSPGPKNGNTTSVRTSVLGFLTRGSDAIMWRNGRFGRGSWATAGAAGFGSPGVLRDGGGAFKAELTGVMRLADVATASFFPVERRREVATGVIACTLGLTDRSTGPGNRGCAES